jgi:hypothetical protein
VSISLLQFVRRCLETVETERTGNQHIRIIQLFGKLEVSPGQIDACPMVNAVGGGGPAAVPVRNFLQLDPQGVANALYRIGIIPSGTFQRTTRVVRNLHGPVPV